MVDRLAEIEREMEKLRAEALGIKRVISGSITDSETEKLTALKTQIDDMGEKGAKLAFLQLTDAIKAAAELGNARCLEILLSNEAVVRTARTGTGDQLGYAIYGAASKGHTECLGLLLNNTMAFEAAKTYGNGSYFYYAVAYSVRNNQPECLEMLLENHGVKAVLDGRGDAKMFSDLLKEALKLPNNKCIKGLLEVVPDEQAFEIILESIKENKPKSQEILGRVRGADAEFYSRFTDERAKCLSVIQSEASVQLPS